MINHFTFNGTSTAQLGLIVSGVSIFGAGSRKVEKAGIPGRNGDLQIELGGFNNYTVRYTVSITKNFTTTAQQIREWLLEAKGYCDLTDTYHPDEIRKACFNSDIEFTTSMLYKYGQASIQFDCLPERYLTTNTPITTTATADTTTDTTMSLSTVPTPINISLNGNTTQEGSSGKNLFDSGFFLNAGWTLTNGYYTGTALDLKNYSESVGGVFPNGLNASRITISFDGYKEGTSANTVRVYIGYTDSTNSWVGVTSTTSTHFSLTSTSGKTVSNVTFSYGSNATTYIKNFQIELGATETAFEPHISPTYPQTIHNVSGDNIINVASKNIFNYEDVTHKGVMDDSGTISTTNTRLFSGKIAVLPDTTYTFKTSAYSQNNERIYINRLIFYGKDGSFLRRNATYNPLSEATFTIPSDVYFLVFDLRTQALTTNLEKELLQNNTQLEKGSTATTYEPYTAQSYPLYLPVKNLLNLINSTLTSYGVIFAINDGIVTAKGTTSRGSYGETDAITNGLVLLGNYGNYANVAENNSIEVTEGSYTLSADIVNNGNTQGGLFIGVGVLGARPTTFYKLTSGSYTVTATSGQRIMLAIWYEGNASATNVDLTISNIQLEKGTKANHYTPYGTAPIELNKIGTYSDYIYKNGGKWYLHKVINKVDLGTLTWVYNTSYAHPFFVGTLTQNIVENTNAILSTSYTYITFNEMAVVGHDSGITAPSGTQLRVSNYSYTDATAFKNASNGVLTYYPLATPTNTEITDTTLINQLNNIEKAYSYDGGTNILQVSNDNGFMLEVVSLHGSTFNSNYKGEPIITVNSTGLIYLNGEVMEVLSAPVTINCQTMQCYNGVVNMNNEVRVNDFPEIKIGENTVGSSMALTITPNNWRH